MQPANDNRRNHGFMPRGLSRAEAAFYFGISPSLFDGLVKEGRAPSPRTVNTRTVWDVRDLDAAFDSLPYRDSPSAAKPWDDVA
nr:XRE family transcriptional regulator [Bosea sp. WAO]